MPYAFHCDVMLITCILGEVSLEDSPDDNALDQDNHDDSALNSDGYFEDNSPAEDESDEMEDPDSLADPDSLEAIGMPGPFSPI